MADSSKTPPLRVCHLTTAHGRKDVRVYQKECISLAKAGYEVVWIVNDGLGFEETDKITTLDLGGCATRLCRFAWALPRSLFKALSIKAEVYHFHDPDLLLVGLILSAIGKNVVYDVHEDMPSDMHSKNWIPTVMRRPLSFILANVEKFASRRFAACVCATDHINQRFKSYGAKTILLRNYPTSPVRALNCKVKSSVTIKEDEFKLCYAGNIGEERGIREKMQVASRSKTRLTLMGPFRSGKLLEELSSSNEWKWIDYLGVVDKQSVEEQYKKCSAGLVLLQRGYGYEEALPVKMFEYMMFKLPVICSDFPLWRNIVEENNCGVLVDPANIEQVVQAVIGLKENRITSLEMGKLGSAAVNNKYNWLTESELLLELYKSFALKCDTA